MTLFLGAYFFCKRIYGFGPRILLYWSIPSHQMFRVANHLKANILLSLSSLLLFCFIRCLPVWVCVWGYYVISPIVTFPPLTFTPCLEVKQKYAKLTWLNLTYNKGNVTIGKMFLPAVVGKLLFGGTIGRGIVNVGNDIAPCGLMD